MTPPTPTSTASDAELRFADAAQQALTAEPAVALDELGYWDLLTVLDDHEARTAAFAVFLAQGRTLASTPAIGGLAAVPFVAGTDLVPGPVVATIPRTTSRGATVPVVVGDVTGRTLLVDAPSGDVHAVDTADVELRPLAAPGGLVLHEVTGGWSGSTPVLPVAAAATARARSLALVRLALAWEMVGAAHHAVALAVAYAGDRRQFGAPIGTFQAVRHLLAWARTDCEAAEGLARQLVVLGDGAPDGTDALVKALAGRNGRKACERALQVLGGIGFTDEHDHHRYHQRVLALDALAGTSAALTAEIGARARTAGTVPRLPLATLAVTAPT